MNNFKLRREKLLKDLPDHSLVIFYAGNLIKSTGDNYYDFCVNRNFYYLSNINQENCYLVLVKNHVFRSYLFIDEFDEKKEKWYGKKMTPTAAKSLSGVNQVFLNSTLKSKIKSLLNNVKQIYFDETSIDGVADLKKEFKNYKQFDISSNIVSLRLIKDQEEIDNIKEAIHITHYGLKKIIKKIKVAKNEYEVFNTFNHEILKHGSHEIAFPSIIASGIHACCLHYPTPYDKLPSNGLILCDVGAAYQHYSADVTRTYPLNGRFNHFQKMIYEIVLGCNKEVIKYIRVGRTIKELQTFAKDYLASRCLERGLIKNAKEIDKYYYHNISHSLGLDTHDVGGRDLTLKPGMVITVEPGLYIEDKATGVRIEDDVLVTPTGAVVLSKDIAKEIDDIEKLF